MTIKDDTLAVYDILAVCREWINNKSYIGTYAMTNGNSIWMVDENNYRLVLACDPLSRVAFGVVPSWDTRFVCRDIINTAMGLFRSKDMPNMRLGDLYPEIRLGIWAPEIWYGGLPYGKLFPLTDENYGPLQINPTEYGQYMVDEVKKSKAELANIYACMDVKTYNSIRMEGCVKEEPLSLEITFMA